ncbi:hypothetical protein Fmac_017416 [Flemingia macrophylla]|uniref:Disease resistance protein At1g50180 n=1 Tax=Flemingia macrophylla TaxID=520843 RepID=A0ABD1M213_9FABA
MAAAVVSFAVERLYELLIEEDRFLSGVGDKVRDIRNELMRMQCFLSDVERRQDESEIMKNLILEIRKLVHRAEDVVEIYAINVAFDSIGTKYPLSKALHLLKVRSHIIQFNNGIVETARRLQNYGLTALRGDEDNCFPYEAWLYSEEFLVGLDEDINKVVKWLVDENQHCRVVFICGMAGIGKTTLARRIYHYNAIRRNFMALAWANISQQYKRREVWERILLGLISPSKEERDQIFEMGDNELARKLFKVQQEKKCLIILDDIWSNQAWDILRPAFPSENTRSKIVFTSRNKDILHVDPNGLLHEPSCLNPENSWVLLQEKAFPRQYNSAKSRVSESLAHAPARHAPVATVPMRHPKLRRKATVQVNSASFAVQGELLAFAAEGPGPYPTRPRLQDGRGARPAVSRKTSSVTLPNSKATASSFYLN